MSTALTIRDETTFAFGSNDQGFTLSRCPDGEHYGAQLIRARVLEVRGYSLRHPGYFRGLVQPTDAERTLNGFQVRR